MKNLISKLIGGSLVILLVMTTFGSTPAHAAVVSISVTGIQDHTGAALPAGRYVQVIQSADATRGAPGANGLPTGGDTVVSTGTINPVGTFSGAASVTASNYVYIRVWETWNGAGSPPAGTYYGDGAAENVGTGFTYTYDPAGFRTDLGPVPGTLQFSAATYSVNENGATVTITVSRTGGSNGAVGVTYGTSNGTATAGQDYTAANGTLSWADGDSASKTFTVSITNDTLDENDETVNLALSAPTGGATLGAPNTAVLTITDDDPQPTVGFTSAAQASAGESGTMTITAQLSTASGLPVTVPFSLSGTATNGTDYTITASPITIPAGSTTGTITITISADTTDEDDETVIVTMGAPTNATAAGITVHTATITDDDAPPTVQFGSATSSGSEGTTPANIPVTLSAASGKTVTVNYAVTGGTATGGGVDYTLANGTLTFNPGQVSRNISAAIVDDAAVESDETIIITLSGPTNATLVAPTTHTYTITDNDVIGAVNITGITRQGTTDAWAYVYDTIVITGTNFGADPGNGNRDTAQNKVTISGLTISDVIPDSGIEVYSWSATQIVVGIPSQESGTYIVAGDLPVVVTAGGTPSNSRNFEVRPRIYGLDPANGLVGAAVKINGTAYGATPANVSISFNGTAATVGTTANSTIETTVPTGATTGNLTVTVNGKTSNAVTFTVSAIAPSITSVTPNNGTQGQTGLSLTVTGANVTWSGIPTISFSGTGITVSSPETIDATHVRCQVAINATAATGVRDVTVNGTTGTAMFTVNTGGTPGLIVIDDFEGSHVSDFVVVPTSGYYTFGAGITPNNTNINAQGPSSVNPYEKTRSMHMLYSNPSAAALSYGGGWGAILITPVDLSSAVMVSVRVNGDNSGNYVRLELKETDGDSLAATDPASTEAAIRLDFTGYREFTYRVSDFVVNPDPTSSTGDGAMQWQISGYNLIYSNGADATATTTYHDIDYLVAYDATANLLQANPSSLSFSSSGATAPAAQTISITNMGPASLNWTASTTSSWIGLGSASGATPGNLSVSVNTAGLSRGDYNGTITLSSATALNSPITVPVTLALGTGVEITSIDPAIGPAGSTITCYGTQFGSEQGSSSLLFIANNGTSTQAKIKSWSDSRIEAIVPVGLAKGDYEIKVLKILIVLDSLRAYESNKEPFEVSANATAGLATIYPNPFDPNSGEVSHIIFDPGTASSIGVYIYDMSANLVYQGNLSSGTTNFDWDGYAQNPRMKVGDGVYLLRVINEDNRALIARGKILVVKQ